MDTPTQQNKPGKLVKTVLSWAEDLVLAIVIIVAFFSFLFRVITVTGSSMSPNYDNGDKVLMTDCLPGLHQGDVVVIGNVLEEPIIKRVIATEGQTVDFDYEQRAVLVDGQVVDESRFGLSNGITDMPYTSFELLKFPQKVPENCIFVLGDNRGVSEDSRYQAVGMIDKRNILGKVIFHLFPFERFGPAQ